MLDGESGVSVMIGTVLLISITVMFAASITTFVMAVKIPEDEPITSLAVTAENVDNENVEIIIHNLGGESIPVADLSIWVTDRLGNMILLENWDDYILSGGESMRSTFKFSDLILPGDSSYVKVLHEPSRRLMLVAPGVSIIGVEPTLGVSLEIELESKRGENGENLTFLVTVTNEGNLEDTFSIGVKDNFGWQMTTTERVTFLAYSSVTVENLLAVEIPGGAVRGEKNIVTLTATSKFSPKVSGSDAVNIRVGKPVTVIKTVCTEPDPLVDDNPQIGVITGGTLDDTHENDDVYENIGEVNIGWPGENCYVTSENVYEGGGDPDGDPENARLDDEIYENLHENSHGDIPESGFKVQQGRTKLTSSPEDIPITAVNDPNRAFVLLTTYHAYGQLDATPGSSSKAVDSKPGQFSAYLLDTSTIRVERSATTSDVWITWQVIECTDEEFYVYRGDQAYSGTTTSWTPSIGGTVTGQNCLAWVNGATNNQASRNYADEAHFTAEVASGSQTQLTIKREANGTAEGTLRWVVVEFDTDKIDSIQTGETTVTNPIQGDRATVSISDVDTTDSILLFQIRVNGNGLTQLGIAGQLDSATEISFYAHDRDTTPTRYIRWYVIDFGSDCGSKQNDKIDKSGAKNWYDIDQTLDEIDKSRTISFVSLTCDGTGTAFPRVQPNAYIETTTNLNIWRSYHGQGSWIEWQVLELPYSPAGPGKYRENIQHNIIGLPDARNYELQIQYYTAGDSEGVGVYLENFSSGDWESVGTLQGGNETTPEYFAHDLTGTDYISADDNVHIRYVQPDNDTSQTSLMIDYCRVKVENIEHALRWEHRIENVQPVYDNYWVHVEGYTSGDEENVGVYIWNASTSGWEFLDNLDDTEPKRITRYIDRIDISDYIVLDPVGDKDNICIKYEDWDNVDGTGTTLHVDLCIVVEEFV